MTSKDKQRAFEKLLHCELALAEETQLMTLDLEAGIKEGIVTKSHELLMRKLIKSLRKFDKVSIEVVKLNIETDGEFLGTVGDHFVEPGSINIC